MLQRWVGWRRSVAPRPTVGVDETLLHRVVPNQRRELMLSDSTVEDHRLASVVFGKEDIRRGATDPRGSVAPPTDGRCR